MTTYRIGYRTVLIHEGDICAAADVDGHVSSDDNWLTHGGGVSARLWRGAGPTLDAEAKRLGPLKLGDVAVTTSGELPSTRLLHAITIDFDADRQLDKRSAAALYSNVLATAAEQQLTHIAMPLLGSGSGGLRRIESLEALIGALQRAALDPRGPRTITLCDYLGFEPRYRAALAVATDTWPNAHSLQHALMDHAREQGCPWTLEDIEPWRSVSLMRDLTRDVCRAHDIDLPPQQTLAQMMSALQAPNNGLPRHLLMLLQDAVRERNYVVHTKAPLASALPSIRHYNHQAMLDIARTVGLSFSPHATDARTDSTPGPPPRADEALASTETSIPTETLQGTEHVRALQQFLLEYLSEKDLRDLVEDLRHHGYKGKEELCILEACVRADPPDQLLNDYFTVGRLRQIVRERTGQTTSGLAMGTLQRLILDDLGFPNVPGQPPTGLATIHATIHAEVQRLTYGIAQDEVRGMVIRVSVELERLLHLLLRFLCIELFQQPPAICLQRLGVIANARELKRASLGRLLGFTEFLGKHLDSSQLDENVALRLRNLQSDINPGLLVSQNAQRLASLRNLLSHYRQSESGAPGESPVETAQAFLNEAQCLVASFRECNVFPSVLRIQEVRYDRWRRRVVRAINDHGHEEVLFTHVHVEPGMLYLMHPLSNPLRVDPILVPIGHETIV